MARYNWISGDYRVAQVYAYESQRVARVSADFYSEARALAIQAKSLYALGDYKQSISLCNRARDLLGLCDASGGQLDHTIMTDQAEIHRLKSEYNEAQNIHSRLLEEVSIDQDLYQHAFTLLNIAEIDVSAGAPMENLQKDIQTASKLFNTMGFVLAVTMCETILADLYLREGNIQGAENLLKKCIRSSRTEAQITSYCLERLGDVSR
jgi:tetratricopeptide (TPR) repeat protein